MGHVYPVRGVAFCIVVGQLGTIGIQRLRGQSVVDPEACLGFLECRSDALHRGSAAADRGENRCFREPHEGDRGTSGTLRRQIRDDGATNDVATVREPPHIPLGASGQS